MLSRYTAVIVFFPCIIILLFGEETIRLLFGAKWLPATRPFQILMIVTALRAVVGYWDPVFMNEGKTKVFLVAGAINSLLLPLTGYTLTRFYGITGMSIAVLLSMSLVVPFLVRQLKQVLDVGYIAVFREPLLVAGITLLAGRGLALVTSHSSTAVLLMDYLIIAVIYILLLLLLIPRLSRDALSFARAVSPGRFD
jgi:O-antigen/teichoic acid export membrane protein